MNRTGELLRFYRRRAKLSQDKLAKRLGVTATFISNIERGISPVPTRLFRKVTEYLELSPLKLLEARVLDIEEKALIKAELEGK